MYTSKHFKNTNDEEVKRFIKQNSFGVLVSQVNGKLWGTHIPLELSDDGQKLQGHVSRANAQWKDFKEGNEVLAIFTGPHTYVSSSWYGHENVPTWNYIAVHVYGTIKIIEGDQLYQSLKRLVDKYEAHVEHPVSVERMSAEYVQQQMRGIVGFEISITSIEATYKLSQNRDKEDHQSVIDHLEERTDHNSKMIASAMRANIKDNTK